MPLTFNRALVGALALLVIDACYALWVAPRYAWGFRVAPAGVTLAHGLAAGLLGAFVVIAGQSRAVSASIHLACGALLALISAAAFTYWRAATPLDGDGLAMLSDVLTGAPVPHTEPLAQLAQQAAYLLHLQLVPAYDNDLLRIVMGSAAAVSIGSGIIAVACVFAARGGFDSPSPPAMSGRFVLTAIVCSQGAVALFFGHLEHYALVAALWIAFTVCGLTAAAPGPRLWITGLLFAVALWVHIMSVALLPAWITLVWAHSRHGQAMRPVGWAVALILAPVALGVIGVALLAPRAAAVNAPWEATVRWLLAAPRDPWGTLNSVQMTGVAGFVSAIVGVFWVWSRRTRATSSSVFVAVLAVSACVPLFLLSDTNLGFARNWDLYAPLALLAALSGGLLLREALPAKRYAVVGGCIVGLSLLHTIPMIATLSDRQASEIRFARLPLAAGNAAATLGLWYAVQGEESRAEAEWRRGVEEAPGNVRLRLQLGHLELRRGRSDAALDQYRYARRLAPGLMAPVAGEIVADLMGARIDAARALAAEQEAALGRLLGPGARAQLSRWIHNPSDTRQQLDVSRSLRAIALGRR